MLILRFVLIQFASLVLSIMGIPICAVLAWGGVAKQGEGGLYHWPRAFWIWDDAEDGTCPTWYRVANPGRSNELNEWIWTALRNPCNNLRYVRGVSRVGWPLWRRTWGAQPGGWYFQAGWNASGYPVLSGGRNVHPW